MVHRPFFSYFGSKWTLSKRYPAPIYDVIVEPFCGSAGYASRHWHKSIVLCDADPIIANLWAYLISVKESEIRGLPLIDHDKTIDDYILHQEAKWLIGFWITNSVTSPRKTPTSRMKSGVRPNGFWGPSAREMIASQLKYIRHWRVFECSYENLPVQNEATWFLDPPYEKCGKEYRKSDIDYARLAEYSLSRKGQVLVCENEGATWLPFEPFRTIRSNRSGKKSEAVSKEVLFYREGERQNQ